MEIELIDDILEALLFVSGDGLKIADICDLLELQKSEVNSAVKRLQKRFGGKFGIHLITYNGKIQFASNPEYSDVIACVLNPIKEKALSNPALETLSIIAYRQPVTRLEVEHIRGVNCDYALQALLKNNLIEIVGRKDSLGKPLLFGTTENFLKRFRIEDIEQLPDREVLLEKIRQIEESAPEPTEAELYNYADKEEKPDFLEGEDVVKIEADEAAATDDTQ
ncbi:MAG: SMC-Scp complex subunit ScpB [Roseburia sp.]|nr:SMC-Scp complex subunit ScpB [Roseburia sp.]